MLELRGYQFIDKIYETQRTLIYSGKRNDGKPVTIKILAVPSPSQQEIAQFEHEFRIGSMLKIPGVREHLALENYGASRAIVFDEFAGLSLDKKIASGPVPLKEFLYLAVEIVKIIGDIHKHQVIHKDIKPQNILYNENNRQVKVIDFSIASEVKKEVKNAVNPDHLEGTLSYISPEQTGRMNRSVDFRTDYYSLGVTFYQMLTGKLPFTGKDAMEIVHAHMAVKPKPVDQLNPGVPSVLSDIVMKLMSKTAEERYQGVEGLLADLKECISRLEQTGKIDPFQIGARDESGIFQIPEKLYGREKESKLLFDEFEKVSIGNTAIVFFDGISGSGKSFLINEIQKPLVRQRGYFVSGKYDQFKKNIPYSAVIQAFQDLIRQILTESQDKLDKWKSELMNALGENGQIVIDVVPELELVIGKQPAVVKLEAAEAQNRFNYVFERFIKVFTTREHPLVVFLDDLQWADGASLKWLDMTLKDRRLGYFLFIGAYRNNEVTAAHPLTLVLENLNKDKIEWKKIDLGPLSEDDISHMIGDTLHVNPAATKPLAGAVKLKTDGNPLFVNEYLKTLYAQEYIVFDGGWKWDLVKIQNAKMPDNVVEFMAEKIKRLPAETLGILKSASCMGVRIYMDTFSQVSGKSVDTIFNLFKPAVNEGMLVKQEDQFLFAHDRIQEAVYQLLDDASRNKTHYNIGRELLKHTRQDKMDEQIFAIVHQLNLGVSQISSEQEKLELAKLNIRSALKAKDSTAYEAAEKYLLMAESLLPEQSWKKEYELKLQVSTELGEVLFQTNQYERMEEYFGIVIKNARTSMDKIRIYELKGIFYTIMMKFPEGLKALLEGFKILKVKIPKKVDMLYTLKEVITLQMKLGNRKIEDLINLPEMKDARMLAAMRLLMAFTPLAYIAYPDHTPVIIIKMIKLSLKYGNSFHSAFGYAGFGVVTANVLGDPVKGHLFSKLGLAVVDKFNAKSLKCRVSFVHYHLVFHWSHPLKETIPNLYEAYQVGKENGDILYAGYSVNNALDNLIFQGINLNDANNQFVRYIDDQRKLNSDTMQKSNEGFYQFVHNMIMPTKDKTRLTGDITDVESNIELFYKENHYLMMAYQFSLKQMLLYIFKEYGKSIESGHRNRKYLDSALGMPMVLVHHFYYTLALLAAIPDEKAGTGRKYLKTALANQKKLKTWAKFSPANVEHKYVLTEAERMRLFPRKYTTNEVIRTYERAVELARKNEYQHEEAIANERAGRFCLERGLKTAASAFLTAACNCYVSWGAVIKVNDLRGEFPELIAGETRKAVASDQLKPFETTLTTTISTGTMTTTGTSTTSQSQFLDIATVMKASGAISGEIVMEKLYGRLLKILMENVGADKSVLVLSKENGLFAEAQAEALQEEVKLLNSQPLTGSERVPESLVNYVARTMSFVVLKDAETEGAYTKDPYILKNRPKSVLSAPILNQNRLTGVLYLENSMASGAFTPERLQILKMLGGQIGISLENAKLYEEMEDYSKNLEKKVEERTSELNEVNKELQKKQKMIMNELNVAKTVQTALIPQEAQLPKAEGLEFGAMFLPMEDIGGDMYDVVKIDERTVGILIADVSGHGVPSALITTLLKATFRYNAKPGRKTAEMAASINEEMVKLIGGLDQNFSAFFGILNLGSGVLEYTNGGHQPAIWYKGERKELASLSTEGDIFGKRAGVKYGQGEAKLGAGDGVLFYTDGIVGARNGAGEHYQVERLKAAYKANGERKAGEFVSVLQDDLKKFCGNIPADDDRTILYVKVNTLRSR